MSDRHPQRYYYPLPREPGHWKTHWSQESRPPNRRASQHWPSSGCRLPQNHNQHQKYPGYYPPPRQASRQTPRRNRNRFHHLRTQGLSDEESPSKTRCRCPGSDSSARTQSFGHQGGCYGLPSSPGSPPSQNLRRTLDYSRDSPRRYAGRNQLHPFLRPWPQTDLVD